MLHPTKYTRWYTLLPDGTHFVVAMAIYSVSVSCPFKMKYYHLRLNKQNTCSSLRCIPVSPSLSLLYNNFNCISCAVQLQIVVFDFKEEGTGTEHVAIATTKCIPWYISQCATSLPSFNSIASLLAEIFLILCHSTVLAQPVTSSVAKFA